LALERIFAAAGDKTVTKLGVLGSNLTRAGVSQIQPQIAFSALLGRDRIALKAASESYQNDACWDAAFDSKPMLGCPRAESASCSTDLRQQGAGVADTPGLNDLLASSPTGAERRKSIASGVPLGRLGAASWTLSAALLQG
jgi:hypothetical protein